MLLCLFVKLVFLFLCVFGYMYTLFEVYLAPKVTSLHHISTLPSGEYHVDPRHPVSVGPFRRRAFFHRVASVPALNDVTLVTHAMIDQLDQVIVLADLWGGRVSLAVAIVDEVDDEAAVSSVMTYAAIHAHVDIHLLYAQHARYPGSHLRNLALRHAQTDWVVQLDIDFLIGAESRAALLDTLRRTPSAQPMVAYVVPAFSCALHEHALPSSKSAVARLFRLGLVDRLDETQCWQCQHPTDYGHWMHAAQNYAVRYAWLYQPVLMTRRSETPLHNENVDGLSHEAVAYAFEVAARGFEFSVLANAFAMQLRQHSVLIDRSSMQVQQEFLRTLPPLCASMIALKRRLSMGVGDSVFGEPRAAACSHAAHWIGTPD